MRSYEPGGLTKSCQYNMEMQVLEASYCSPNGVG